MSESRNRNKVYTRNTRSRTLALDVDLDLNQPPTERSNSGVEAAPSNVPERQLPRNVTRHHSNTISLEIDMEGMNDDVIISSPRTFAEARNMSRRTRVTTTISLDDGHANPPLYPATTRTRPQIKRSGSGRRSSANPIIICDDDSDSGTNIPSKRKRSGNVITKLPEAAPKEISFSCVICMSKMTEPTSTTCGHLFCNDCIKRSLTAKKECPTCRSKLSASKIHRIYLPKASVD